MRPVEFLDVLSIVEAVEHRIFPFEDTIITNTDSIGPIDSSKFKLYHATLSFLLRSASSSMNSVADCIRFVVLLEILSGGDDSKI